MGAASCGQAVALQGRAYATNSGRFCSLDAGTFDRPPLAADIASPVADTEEFENAERKETKLDSAQFVPSVTAHESIDSRRKRALKGAVFSEYIDMFDMYLPVIILAPIQGYFLPSGLTGAEKLILESLIFVTTLIGRPLGAILFGRVADRLGRRTASIISAIGFSIFTLLIALIPGYESIGVASYWLLISLRFVDGFFLGGGYAGALPLAIEYSRKDQRCLVGAYVLCGFAASYVSINLVAKATFLLFPLSGIDSPYAMWGWRLPFVLGSLMAMVLAFYYGRQISESEVWAARKTAKPSSSAESGLIRKGAWKDLAQILFMMTGFWLTSSITAVYIPTGVLRNTLHLSYSDVTLTLMASYLAVCPGYIIVATLGRWIGRRTILSVGSAVVATLGAFLLHMLIGAEGMPLSTVIVLVAAILIIANSMWSVVIAYINERFATGVRATGFGIGYSLSIIAPSFYAFYLNWMSLAMPARFAPVVLMCIAGTISGLGAFFGPETKDVDL